MTSGCVTICIPTCSSIAFGKNVAALRKARSVTQQQLAEDISVSVVTIAYIETGKQWVRPKTLIAIAKSLGISTSDFFRGLYLYPKITPVTHKQSLGGVPVQQDGLLFLPDKRQCDTACFFESSSRRTTSSVPPYKKAFSKLEKAQSVLIGRGEVIYLEH